MYDCIIVGGGPAGLSAALILGRTCRKVIVCDAGSPRNAASRSLNGYLTREGVSPQEFLRLAREEVSRCGVETRDAKVCSARCLSASEPRDYRTRFEVTLDNDEKLVSRKLLLATGVVDCLPEIEGMRQFYGTSVHHCPYCDGWEHRGMRLVAFGEGKPALGLALALRNWSEHVVACTHGIVVASEDHRRLQRNGITVREDRVVRLEGSEGHLQRIVFENGAALECDALFFNTDQFQQSDLPAMLGCVYKPHGHIRTEPKQRTGIPGLYLAGDADGDVQFVVVAAGEGATAAVAISRELQDEDRGEA